VTARHDYQPFGEEILRASYGADTVRKQFTSYERDNETELDFAQARMFSYGHGRFTSPDNFLNDTSQIEPKSWNLYVYVLNNPMNSVDPLGEQVQVALPKDADQRKKVKEEILKRLNYTYDCDGCVTIDDNGVLSVDPSDLSDEVNKATGYLTNAINADSNDFFAVIKVTNANDNVAFARTGRGTITRNGKKEQVNVIELDFDDAKYLRGDKDLINVFDYTTIAHEVRHLYPDAANDPEPSFSGRERGTVVNAVNEIMLATGRPLRANYYADSSAQL
jgi:RHS repeat-associated protein